MEKLRNILSPGKSTEGEVQQSSGQSSDPVQSGTGTTGGLSGEGSHLSKTHETPRTTGITDTQHIPGAFHSTDTTDASNTHHLGRDAAIGAGAGAGGAGLADHGAGPETGFEQSQTSPTYTHEQGPGTGFSNTQNTGYGSGTTSNTTDQPVHDSKLLNKVDPRVDSKTTGNTAYGSGTTSNTTSQPGYGSGTTNNPQTSSGHHYGRDAAALGTAGVVGEGIHHHRENERDNLGTSTTQGGYDGNTPSGQTGAYHGGPTGTAVSGPHATDTANRLDPHVNTKDTAGLDAHQHSQNYGGGVEAADKHHTQGSSGHHLGRDAAVGAGGVGLAEHEHRKHEHHKHEDSATAPGATNTSGLGQAGAHDNTTGSSGHHLGRDAAIGAGGVGLAEHEHHKHEHRKHEQAPNVDQPGTGTGTGTGSRAFPLSQSTGTHGSSGHHYGRDAAVGAGGVGLAEHEHHKHEGTTGTSGTTGRTTDTSTLPGPAPNTAGPHKKDWLNKLDPRVNAKGDDTTTGTTHDSHKGRDAAGVGAVGAGAYEVEKHHHNKQSANDPSHSSTTAGPHSSAAANKADPRVDSDKSKDHHYGRDAAGLGAVGAGAYEVEKHHHNKQTANDPSHSTTTGPHSSAAANKADLRVDSDKSKDHHYGRDAAGLGAVGAGAYEADKHHKHEKDLKAAEKEHKHEAKEEGKEHKGGLLSFLHRDKNKKYTPEEEAEFDRQEREYNSHKGRDAAGVGALGAGAYEAEKHHHNTSSLDNKPLPTAPGNHGVGTGTGPQNALAGEAQSGSGHHYGRDAALAGGAGAVGLHEHNKSHGPTPLHQKPVGTDLGDKLHGVERNRGVQGSSGTQSYGNEPFQSGTTSQQHHYGRDAAGLGGAAALGEHEHRKHENVGGSGVGHHYDNTSSGLGSGQTSGVTGTGNQHHLGRDAAGFGAAGVVGEHKYRKHEGTGAGTGAGYDHGITTQDAGYSGQDGRNRLHKDPPASHATSGHSDVPVSSTERSNLTGEGQQRLDQTSGVSNPGGSVNPAANY